MTHPADKAIGWEWAERYPHVYRDPPLRLEPSACPVCGHPTGACTQEDHETMATGRTTPEENTPIPNTASLQGGYRTAEDAETMFAGPVGPTMVVVKEDVYWEVEDPNATTKRQRISYHKGQIITEDEAKANKVKAVQQQNLSAGEKK